MPVGVLCSRIINLYLEHDIELILLLATLIAFCKIFLLIKIQSGVQTTRPSNKPFWSFWIFEFRQVVRLLEVGNKYLRGRWQVTVRWFRKHDSLRVDELQMIIGYRVIFSTYTTEELAHHKCQEPFMVSCPPLEDVNRVIYHIILKNN